MTGSGLLKFESVGCFTRNIVMFLQKFFFQVGRGWICVQNLTIRTDVTEMQCYKKKAVLLSLSVCLLVQILFCIFAYYRSTMSSKLPDSLSVLYSRGGELEPEREAIYSKLSNLNAQFEMVVQETTETRKLKQELKREETSAHNPDKTTSLPRLLGGAPSLLNRYNYSINSSLVSTTDWDSGSFCHQFLVKTFQKPIPVCANVRNGAVQCFGSPFSDHMSTCILENMVVSPRDLGRAMYDADYTKFKDSEPSIALLSDRGSECHNMTVIHLRKHVESGDYVWKIVDKMKQENPKPSLVCDKWINDDVFFFTAHRFHIYFRFLDYFNLHKMLEDFKYTLSNNNMPRILRISGSNNYHFADFDQQLFPEVNFETLDHLGNASICFRKVILVPKSYSSVLHQCKMPSRVRRKCSDCNGWGLSKTQILSFRDRVLRVCSLNDGARDNANSTIIFVSRKQYLRNENDERSHFERVMDNEDNLVAGLRKHFNSSVVQKVHFEDLGICEQVGMVHNADVYLGVHGSGLVHLWWLREGAVVYELEPHYEVGNPTFRTLARLSGRKYKKSSIGGGWGKVHARVDDIVADLEKLTARRNSSDGSDNDRVAQSLRESLQFPYRLGIL